MNAVRPEKRPTSCRSEWSRDLSVGLLKPIGFPLVKEMSPLRADGCQPSGRHDLCSIKAATTARQAGHVERRRRGAEPASRPLLELGNTDRACRPQRGFSTSPLRSSGLRSKRPVFVRDCLPPPLQVMSSGSRPLSGEVETHVPHTFGDLYDLGNTGHGCRSSRRRPEVCGTCSPRRRSPGRGSGQSDLDSSRAAPSIPSRHTSPRIVSAHRRPRRPPPRAAAAPACFQLPPRPWPCGRSSPAPARATRRSARSR